MTNITIHKIVSLKKERLIWPERKTEFGTNAPYVSLRLTFIDENNAQTELTIFSEDIDFDL